MNPCVYRMFDADGHLLYVGVTSHGFQRLEQYRYSGSYFRRVARVELQHFDDVPAALAAEASAIEHEHPEFNRLKTLNKSQLARYRNELRYYREHPGTRIAQLTDEEFERMVGAA